jgi:hypothetical protein
LGPADSHPGLSRQTHDDIAEETGERRPKESEQSGEEVKVVIGIDPDRV